MSVCEREREPLFMAQINNKQSIDISFSNHSLSVFVLLQGENDGLLPQEYEHFGLMRQREKFTLFPFFFFFLSFFKLHRFLFPALFIYFSFFRAFFFHWEHNGNASVWSR